MAGDAVPVEFAFKLPMYGQSSETPFSIYIELAQQAESAGFTTAYVIDHLRLPSKRLIGKTNADADKPYFIDPWCTLAAVAACTTTIRLGPQVTPIGLRHPVFVAKWGATIDRISNGRFTLGVGLGHQREEYESHGFPFPPFQERYERLGEGVDLIRQLWTQDDPVTFEGNHYQVKDVPFWPKPIQANVPIWFGGASPRIQRAVAQQGDGWFPAAPQSGGLGADGPKFFRDSLAAIRAEATSLGRPGPIGSGAVFLCCISDDLADIERGAELLRRREEYVGKSIDEINDQGAIIMGTPGDVLHRLQPYVDAGLEQLTVSFHPLDDIDGIRRGLELFRTKVMPHFAAAALR
jgi:probable F420-dependent oxidoreductase